MSLWTAIALTVTASACMNLGLVLQKRGLATSPPIDIAQTGLRLSRPRHTPIWYFGMALMIGGYGIYAAAVSARVAPISLLQPLCASGLLVVALMAIVYLNERFDASEWFGVAILLVGVILLGLSAQGPQAISAGIDTVRYLAFFGLTATFAVGVVYAAAVRPQRAELLLGLLSGVLFGTGYLNTKALALAMQDRRTLLVIVASCQLTLGLVGGLVALQMGLRRGRALIVTAVNLVTNQVIVVCGGLFCLGEQYPRQSFPFLARTVGLAGILMGIVLLARVGAASGPSPESADELPRAESNSVSL